MFVEDDAGAIDRAMLEGADARLLVSGGTEESIIEGTKKRLRQVGDPRPVHRGSIVESTTS